MAPNIKYLKIQKEINEMINSLGGYWDEATCLLRINEELAELIIEITANNTQKITEELADLMMVTLIFANKLKYTVNAKPLDNSFEYMAWLNKINIEIGQIARNINANQGIKKPKANEQITNSSINLENIANLIMQYAIFYKINIEESIEKKIDIILKRDKRRFKK